LAIYYINVTEITILTEITMKLPRPSGIVISVFDCTEKGPGRPRELEAQDPEHTKGVDKYD
jgi:hypothetical protein